MQTAARIEIYSLKRDFSAQVYTIYAQLKREQLMAVAKPLLSNENNWRIFLFINGTVELIESNLHAMQDNWYHQDSLLHKYVSSVDEIGEISYHFGVTDNIGNTLQKMIEQQFHYTFKSGEGVCSSQLFMGKNDKFYFNPLIQKFTICGSVEKKIKFDNVIIADIKPISHRIRLENVDLTRISKQMLLGLSERAMIVIRDHFRELQRDPYDIELETLAQTWSEHCKHTIFSSPVDEIEDGLYRHYIKRATNEIMQIKKDFCISVFQDNAGAISFTEDWLIAAKVETHNSPSALEPYGGSITGILGVNRDIVGFGLGAKPIANMYGFCFADPNKEYDLFRDQERTIPIIPPQEIIKGVIKGVNVGGNCSGIPTPQGFVYYDERFIAKPLVFVGTIGLIPRIINDKPSHLKEPQEGDCIVLIGGHTGKDGIHGATFSSESLSSSSPMSAVQIGDPITQKKLSDAIIKEARDQGLYNAITDNGAGGLSSSVGEMGINGFTVQLKKVPLKYPGMLPWEIWVSESQERMTLSVPHSKYEELQKIMQKHDVGIANIGTFNNSGKAIVKYGSEVILNLDTDFLHNGNPVEHFKTEEIDSVENKLHSAGEINLQSTRFISEQYDHEVQGSSIMKPLQGKGKVSADVTVIRPVLSVEQGIALSHGLGVLTDDDQDPYYMAANAIDTAIRNAVVGGANPDKIALLDNFCWSNPTDPKRLWQLKRAAKACYDYATAFGTPFISGKDSMFNDFKGYDHKGRAIHLTDPPTLLISAVGVVEDVKKCVSLDAKFSGDLVYLLGDNNIHNVNAKRAIMLYNNLYKAINISLIASSISIDMGGLAHAIKRTADGGQLNIEIIGEGYKKVSSVEYPSRILITINPYNRSQFESLFLQECILIGKIS